MRWRPWVLATLLVAAAPSPAGAFDLFRVDAAGQFVRVNGSSGTCPSAPRPRPVLFVHGHEFGSSGTGGTYQANFTATTGPSFAGALARAENQDLGIEAYYIQMLVADRSIFEDAQRIGQAIGLIQGCQDPASPAGVRVAVIGYSKGTISTRVYLRSRQMDLSVDFPGEVALDPPGVNPVTEFVALAPPNHGLRALPLLDTELPVRQMNDGVTRNNCVSYNVPLATQFMTRLNGTVGGQWTGMFETPGNRAKDAPVTSGTLFVAIYATGDRDLVGGDSPDPDGDCNTPPRKQARNLGTNAVNIAIAVSGSTALAVHTATVKDAEVICRALYAVANHRAAEDSGQVCATAPDGNPIIPVGTAVTLVLDHSGSMVIPACPTCVSKQAVLRDAAELFLSTWLALAGEKDRIGITYFRTGVSQYTAPGGATQVPVLPDVSALVTDLDTNATSSSGLTAMGGGVQSAILGLQGTAGPLQAVGPNRNIVLFTDGLQNVNPMIQSLAQLVIATQPGGHDAGIPALLTMPVPQYKVRIHTIGIGPGVTQPSQSILATMATATGGVSRFDMDAAALQQFFTMTLMDALNASSPQLVAYRRGTLVGDEAVERFPITAGVRKVVFTVSWPRNAAALELRVEKGGVDVTRQGRITSGPFYRIFALALPAGAVQAAGEWRVRLGGRAGVTYQAAAIADDHRRAVVARFARPDYRAGEALSVSLELRDGSRPLRGATVTATLLRPIDSAANLLATFPLRGEPAARVEPEAPAGQRAATLLLQDSRLWPRLQPTATSLRLEDDGTGVYRATLPPATVPGVYTMLYEVTVGGAGAAELRRAGAVSAVVRPGPPKAEQSDVRVVPRSASAGGRVAELVVSPRDAFGNYLGPDLGPLLAIRVGGGADVGEIRDLANGSYVVPLVLPEGRDPTVTITVAGETLVAGRASTLAPRPERGPFVFWVGIVALGLVAVLLLAGLTRRRRRVP